MQKGQWLVVQGFNNQGQGISLFLPLNDFSKVHDGPPTDPKVLEDRQKRAPGRTCRNAPKMPLERAPFSTLRNAAGNAASAHCHASTTDLEPAHARRFWIFDLDPGLGWP
jgi:hypothetical protein